MVNALAKTCETRIKRYCTSHQRQLGSCQQLFDELLSEDHLSVDHSNLILFTWLMLLKKNLHHLGMPDEWQAEWKWDGIRGQIIKRNDKLFVWSRGEELMTDKFPEYHYL